MRLTKVKFFFLASAIWITVMILISFYPWLIGAWQEYLRMNQPGPFWEPRRIESLFQFRLLCLHVVLQGVLSAAVFSRLKPRKTYAGDSLAGAGLSLLVALVLAVVILGFESCCVPQTWMGAMGLTFFYVVPISPVLGAILGGFLVAGLHLRTDSSLMS